MPQIATDLVSEITSTGHKTTLFVAHDPGDLEANTTGDAFVRRAHGVVPSCRGNV